MTLGERSDAKELIRYMRKKKNLWDEVRSEDRSQTRLALASHLPKWVC